MSEAITVSVEELNATNVANIKELYETFKIKAQKDYKMDFPALEYEDFCEVIEQNILKALVLYENSVPKALLMYVIENFKSVELNIIHVIDKERVKERKSKILAGLMNILKDRTDWRLISYPMLGVQEKFVQNIASDFKFSFVGQAVVKFNFEDMISHQVLKKAKLADLPEGYTISEWKDEYFDAASDIIYETFKNSKDSLFDPRFKSLDGTKQLVNSIVSGMFGDFLSEATTVLLYQNVPVGIVFCNLATLLLANVPLIGIKSGHKNKGLAKYILRNALQEVISLINAGQIFSQNLNAAVETDNYPALKMYRRLGFVEDYTYPHAYYDNPNYKG